MKAIGYTTPGAADVLHDVELPEPTPRPRDLLVEVEAISVNPVDTKVRASSAPAGPEPKILGWDAAGIVRAVGDEVTRFAVGDPVYYAGAVDRPGTNAQLHVVDERIVGHRPRSIDASAAAAMPLTSITAWELLFDRLGVTDTSQGQLLVVGGAGGVGSMLIQLAAQLTNLTVIATASRPETRDWVRVLGADIVVDHHDLVASLGAAGVRQVEWITSLTGTERNFPALAELVAPQGAIGVIDDPSALDVTPLKGKSVALHWESMFTRSLFGTTDMDAQGALLDEVAALVDKGSLRSTISERFGEITAANLQRAHTHQESRTAIGKSVLASWPQS